MLKVWLSELHDHVVQLSSAEEEKSATTQQLKHNDGNWRDANDDTW